MATLIFLKNKGDINILANFQNVRRLTQVLQINDNFDIFKNKDDINILANFHMLRIGKQCQSFVKLKLF